MKAATAAALTPSLSACGRLALSAHFRLVRTLLRLVGLERLGRVHVAEGRVARVEGLGGRDAEALPEHGAECLDLHVAEAGETRDPLAQVGAVGRLAPDPARVAAVVLGHDRCQI